MSKKILVNKNSIDWYENSIEEPIRELVHYLRDNGINTTCSCGHEMYVECQTNMGDDIYQLYKLIFNYLYAKKLPCTFNISMDWNIHEGVLIHDIVVVRLISMKIPFKESKGDENGL